MNSEERKFLTVGEAKTFLAVEGDIHAFIDSGGMLLGADWGRDAVLKALAEAGCIEVSGAIAQRMKHGLAVYTRDQGLVFFETSRRTDDKPDPKQGNKEGE